MNCSRLRTLLLASGLTGCLSQSPPPRHYLLEPLTVAATAVALPNGSSSGRVITLTAVHIPRYADRPQLVTADNNRQYQLDEFNRWAERLDDNIGRVLHQNLAVLLPGMIVLRNDSRPNLADTVRLSVDILDIVSDATGSARLVTQWTLARHHQILATRQSTHQIGSEGLTPAARVAALNTLLTELSRDIAADLSHY